MVKSLALICMGNICRSPMAEAVFLRSLSGKDVMCFSAGTHALVGRPADPLAQEVMLEQGYDISAHRAQQATPQLMRQADLILALDQLHVDWLLQTNPGLRGRVFKLGKWHGNADVADPYREPRSAFITAFNAIDQYVQTWIGALGKGDK